MNGFFTHQRALLFALVRRPVALVAVVLIVAFALFITVQFDSFQFLPLPLLLIVLCLSLCFRPLSPISRATSLASVLPVGEKTRYAAEAALLLPFVILLAPLIGWQRSLGIALLAFTCGLYLAAWSLDERISRVIIAFVIGMTLLLSSIALFDDHDLTGLAISSVISAVFLVAWPLWLKWKDRSSRRKKEDALDWAVVAAFSLERPQKHVAMTALWRDIWPVKYILISIAVVVLLKGSLLFPLDAQKKLPLDPEETARYTLFLVTFVSMFNPFGWSLLTEMIPANARKTLLRVTGALPVSRRTIIQTIAGYSLATGLGIWGVSFMMGVGADFINQELGWQRIGCTALFSAHLLQLGLPLSIASAVVQAAAGSRYRLLAVLAAFFIVWPASAIAGGVALSLANHAGFAVGIILVISGLFWIPALRCLRPPARLPSA